MLPWPVSSWSWRLGGVPATRPLEVYQDGKPLVIRQRAQRTLLSLLLHANRPVASDWLVEALWGGPAPFSGSTGHRLRTYVWGLRRTLVTGPTPAPAGAGVPRQLPSDVATFTGREAELRRLAVLLDPGTEPRGPVVISAIDGMGGTGKSALAIRAAHQPAERFPDGQRLGRHREALGCHQESLPIFREVGDRHGEAEELRARLRG
jgi:hypothetical protein